MGTGFIECERFRFERSGRGRSLHTRIALTPREHAAVTDVRKWIGIDITHFAISLLEKRLKDVQ